MINWYPQAKVDKFTTGGTYLSGPFRGVIHTTEGKTYGGARSVYDRLSVAPHFTVTTETGVFQVYQHVPLNRAARALANPSGGVQTNRHSAIQIEVVASASRPDWPPALKDGVRGLMIWIEEQTGVKPWSPPFGGSEAYGLHTIHRMTPSAWNAFDGWCGHQHVPENNHWDPGRIDSAYLLYRESDMPTDVIQINHPPRVIVARPQGDGYWIVAYDGGVFAFGAAPPLPAIGGDPVERIISASAWPDGEGLICLGEDGGVFNLGSAAPHYYGRVGYGG